MGESHREVLTLRMEGTFDVPAARLVEHTIARSRAVSIRLDFSRVTDFHDFGVAILAHVLSSRGRAVALTGLRLHQVRLLRYFGVDPAAFRTPLRTTASESSP